MQAAALAVATMLALGSALAVQPDEMLDDPVLEARARELSKEIRCLVCQNQSIDDSNAGLARDLRVLVRERLTAGDDDAAVVQYVVARYGDFVLLRPPVKPSTYLLWLAPALILAMAVVALVLFYRRRRAEPAPAAPLSEDERSALKTLLGEDGAP